ncbi:MAG: Mrp/NBP35 family ATP-binding protein [Legionellaceae bacterium]|nr:Mrp/NBP35 family ATP-binding protein [Legionellaceae bacterium]
MQSLIDATLPNCYLPAFERNFMELGIRITLDDTAPGHPIILQAPFPVHGLYHELCSQLRAQLPGEWAKRDIQCQQTIRSHQTQLSGKALKGVKNTIAIASGKGGVGKSTVAVNLAIALARSGARVGLLDADIYGPSLPIMLGGKQAPQWVDDQYLPVERHGIQAMSIGFLNQEDSALIWRGPMLAKSLLQMMNLTRWDHLDYLLIDLPPGTGDIQLSLVQKIPLTGAVVITTPQQVATADADKAIQMFEKTGISVLGLIENMHQHTCSQCGHREAIFGSRGALELCRKYHINLLAQLPLSRSIQEQCDAGTPSALVDQNPGAAEFKTAALGLAIAIAAKPLNYADKMPPLTVE